LRAGPDPGDLLRNDNGPGHRAPVNAGFSSSFDEFAGVFASEVAVLVGERRASDYQVDRESYGFGYRLADDRPMTRDLRAAAGQPRRKTSRRNGGAAARTIGAAQAAVQQGWREARGVG
jgi:hypothetical protein